ncbi:MAG: GIY-YIG nuclease family protein [Gammaproteobacteria bacterium]|nr:GIY-YIG nuclease family protein [Gammaproteobacteria bacterium]
MSQLILKDLIRLEEPDLDKFKIRVARHVMKGRGWDGFDDLIRFDDDLLTIFAGNMSEDRYKDAEIILTFVALPKSKALFRSAFINNGRISANEAKNHYAAYDRYSNYLKSLNNAFYFGEKHIKPPDLSKQLFYSFEQSSLLKSFRNRLVIDWGKSQTYIQKKLDKEVIEIYPKGFVSFFPGWDKVYLSHKELSEIINHPDGNKDWHEYLSNHSGVYVIFDSSTGKQYIGSASGGDGIWSRWEGYAKTGHNGNKALKAISRKNPDFANNFKYSLHHVFPKTVSKNDVLQYESLLKNKLGSRAYGLNEN